MVTVHLAVPSPLQFGSPGGLRDVALRVAPSGDTAPVIVPPPQWL